MPCKRSMVWVRPLEARGFQTSGSPVGLGRLSRATPDLADLLIGFVRAIRTKADVGSAKPARRWVSTDVACKVDPGPGQTSPASRQVRSWCDVKREAEQPPTTISNSEGQISDERIAGVGDAALPDPPPNVRGRCAHTVGTGAVTSVKRLPRPGAQQSCWVSGSARYSRHPWTCGVYLSNGPKRQPLDLAVRSD